MPLEIGNIVTILSRESLFFNKQGEIVEIVHDDDTDGPIGVKFGKECEHLFGAFTEEACIPIRFLETQLRVDTEWNLETRIIRAFGRMFHSYCASKKTFSLQDECATVHCNHFVDQRCLINIWGTVYELDLCKVCAEEYDGKCGEAFPSLSLVRAS
jgi:hypothetical protein